MHVFYGQRLCEVILVGLVWCRHLRRCSDDHVSDAAKFSGHCDVVTIQLHLRFGLNASSASEELVLQALLRCDSL